MRVKVSEYSGPYAFLPDQGNLVYDLIAPVIERGEPVELDFEGVERIAPPFLDMAVGKFVPIGQPDRLDELLCATNLIPRYQTMLRLVIEQHRRKKVSQTSYDNWLKIVSRIFEDE